MKTAIVGSGFVGSTAAYALVLNGIGREVVLVDMNKKRADAEAADILHAVPFAHPLNVSAGDYPDLTGSRVVIITAGVSQKPGESRMELLGRNAAVFQDVVPKIIEYAPDAVIVVATNPVDIMTHLAARYAREQGIPEGRVLGSGTTLDTARFRVLLGSTLGMDSHHIHGYVIGEHGDSEVLTWSLVSVGGIPLETFCRHQHILIERSIRDDIDRRVRGAAYTIIAGKGATYYGIGCALARIVNVILRDQRAILTVCSPHSKVADVSNVTISLPHIVGGKGVLASIPLPVNEEEGSALHKSALIVRSVIDDLDKAA